MQASVTVSCLPRRGPTTMPARCPERPAHPDRRGDPYDAQACIPSVHVETFDCSVRGDSAVLPRIRARASALPDMRGYFAPRDARWRVWRQIHHADTGRSITRGGLRNDPREASLRAGANARRPRRAGKSAGHKKTGQWPVVLARPEGFEPPTPKFVAWCSIQLSYGRVAQKRNYEATLDVRQSFRCNWRRLRDSNPRWSF